MRVALCVVDCGRILADTPFPFPWAQLLTLFLVSYAISLPFMLVSFVRDVWTAGLLTFLAVLTYWSTNEVPFRSLVAAAHRISLHRIRVKLLLQAISISHIASHAWMLVSRCLLCAVSDISVRACRLPGILKSESASSAVSHAMIDLHCMHLLRACHNQACQQPNPERSPLQSLRVLAE